ncbi:MAG: hypothetical protein NXH95_13755 [Pseudomonadaceae bacterium]|nr:hypothetical protein [Pseudomonadaceae bacterium]
MPKYNVVLFLGSESKGHGWYRDTDFVVRLWEKDGTEIVNQAYADDSTARAAIVTEATNLGWDSEVATQEFAEPVTPTVNAVVSALNVFKGVAAAAQNIHGGVAGSVSAVGWDTTVNDGVYIDAHVDGDSEIVFLKQGQFHYKASIAAINSGLNNRNTYAMRMRWLDTDDVEKDLFYLDDTYIRDDAVDYDSGLMADGDVLIVEIGDKVIFEVEVLDEQTASGTVNADTVKSKIRIDYVSYAV